MPAVTIILDAQGAWPDLAGAKKGELERIGALPGGMAGGMASGKASGKASVALVVRLEDGQVVFAETSLELFLGAAVALRARYADNQPRGTDA